MMAEMQQEQLREIGERLGTYFDHSRRLVFWEDPEGEYRDQITNITVEGASVIDVTGRELFSKRHILRTEKDSRFVVYRAGEPPLPDDDFLLDVKLASIPFTVDTNGIWAEECEIPARLAEDLGVHKRFFASSTRRKRLKETQISKDTLKAIEFAMLAVCAGSSSDNERDAFRDITVSIVVEHAEGKDATYRLICDCAIQDTYWQYAADILGYAPADGPSVADLAFELLAKACEGLLPENRHTISNDALRIVDDIKKSRYHDGAYEALVEEYGDEICQLIPEDMRSLDSIGEADALPQFDRWILSSLSSSLSAQTLTDDNMRNVLDRRKRSYWFQSFKIDYLALLATTDFESNMAVFDSTKSGKTTAQEIFNWYCESWYNVDSAYRSFFECYRKMQNGRFKQTLEAPKTRILARYDTYLMELTGRWQLALLGTPGAYPPKDISFQRNFYRSKVAAAFPAAENGNRVAVIISDGLRFEVGVELADRLSSTRDKSLRGTTEIACEGELCMLPSYTQLGMAALLPDGPMGINPSDGTVEKEGMPTSGLAYREKILDRTLSGSIAARASQILDDGIPERIREAPLVYIYHNTIDATGDKLQTESGVFEACECACVEIERLISELVKVGFGQIFVTADHGFLYQAGDRDSYQYADVANLSLLSNAEGMDMNHTRRFIVADALPSDEMLIEYDAIDLGLEGNARIALVKGTTRLRLRGSGAGYVHGGASLQETAIPVVSVRRVKGAKRASEATVQGIATGRASITGSSVSLDVYQVEPCSQSIMPVNVKVGLYAPDDSDNPGKLLSASEVTLELASESKESDGRRTRLTLDVTNDIDDFSKAVLRISKRVGKTNAFKPVWEQTYSVDRGFGNDFDF